MWESCSKSTTASSYDPYDDYGGANIGAIVGIVGGVAVCILGFIVTIVIVLCKKRTNARTTANKTNVVVVPSANSTEMMSTGMYSCTKSTFKRCTSNACVRIK